MNDRLFEFLIQCCQDNPSQDDIYSIVTAIDTQDIIEHAQKQGILPIVYKRLKSIDNIPNDLLSKLKIRYMQIAQKNILMSAELIKIIKLLETNNIKAIAFKGPTLAQLAYGDITMRQFGDLDIIVEEKNLDKVGQILSSKYRALLPLSILKNNICIQTAKDFSFISNTDIHIELHWRLFEKKYNITSFSEIFHHQYSFININNQKVNTLPTDILLVYLCLHGAKHQFERIEWIVDIDKLICTDSINWKNVIQYVKNSHSNKPFYLGLAISSHLFSTPLPKDFIYKIQDKNIQILKQHIVKKLQSPSNLKTQKEKNKETFLFQSKLFNNWNDRFHFYFSTFFKISTTDCQTFILPEKLKFLYFILRPLRIIFKYTKS